jgi:hypothetical protein
MNGDVAREGDVSRNGGPESAEGESAGAAGFLVRVGGGGEEGERVFEAERGGVMGVGVEGDANGVFACERAEAGEGFAEAVWVAERVFEERELVRVRDGVLDEEGNFGDRCVEPERFEMGLEDAEKDGFFAGGSGDGELAFVHWALVEAQLEVEGRGGAVQKAKARAELFEQSVESEEERRRGFNGCFEGEREVQRVGEGFKLKNAFASVAGHFPERVDFWSETFANVLTREGEEFSEGGEAPFGEVLKEGRREVEFGEPERGDERGGVVDD